jgi:hypothetical protein
MPTILSRESFIPSPKPGTGVMGGSFYTTLGSDRLMSMHSYTSRSDTVDVAYVRASEDGGETWSEMETWPTKFEAEGGTGRRHPRGGYVDPQTGRYITVWTEGVLPTDEPLEGMQQWTMWYSVSEDGGKTQHVKKQIIHDGPTYDAVHHLPGVTVGKNSVMMGDLGEVPLTRSDGTILIPVQSSPTGPDGAYYSPGGGFTYTDCLLLMGRWQEDGQLSWITSDRIIGDPDRTTRGLIEPTIAELNDQSILMVMRGSNDRNHDLPGYKWMARSYDGGQTWSQPVPWTYTDQATFFSPSATSQLIPHSNGHLYWMGNISELNPKGNTPRYPIILGEVDRDNGLLIRESITIIDDRQPGEHERLTLSNFYVREDRTTGDFILHLPRFFVTGDPQKMQEAWTADLMMYRIGMP